MTQPDKLTIEEIQKRHDTLAILSGYAPELPFELKALRQLLDTMRENERLMLKCLDARSWLADGMYNLAVNALEEAVMDRDKSVYPNKDTEHAG